MTGLANSGRLGVILKLVGLGRFLPFAPIWADSLHSKTMLQCDRQESAISSHSPIAGKRLLKTESSHPEVLRRMAGSDPPRSFDTWSDCGPPWKK